MIYCFLHHKQFPLRNEIKSLLLPRKILSKHSQYKWFSSMVLNRGKTPPLGAYINFQGGAIVNMFYNTFFINFDNQNDRKLDLSKNRIEQRNPASFF